MACVKLHISMSGLNIYSHPVRNVIALTFSSYGWQTVIKHMDSGSFLIKSLCVEHLVWL